MNNTGYKVVNGTYYHANTPDLVITALEKARQENHRIRIFYGDTKTGRDYMEHHDVIGMVSRSTGPCKIPLLINNNRSIGGGAIMSNHIVKITIDKTPIYTHPKYHLPHLSIEQHEVNNSGPIIVTGYSLCADRECIYNCNSLDKIKKEIDFLTGKRNKWY